jgi:hypothetical protein
MDAHAIDPSYCQQTPVQGDLTRPPSPYGTFGMSIREQILIKRTSRMTALPCVANQEKTGADRMLLSKSIYARMMRE